MAKIAGEMKRENVSAGSEYDPRITLDLKDVFGVSEIPQDNLLKQEIGQAIVDSIVENTKRGDFLAQSSGAQSYSESYADSFDFKVYGKSKNNVNLTASGDMLRAIDFEINDDGIMSIYFNDETEAAKAHGHITGNIGKKRDFFGLDHKDLILATREYRSVIKDRIEENKSKIQIDEDVIEDDISFVIGLLRGQG
jgi:hypothetical protein